MEQILERPATECSCKVCQAMCNRPCWPTPAEADKLIESGFSDKLMLDYWDYYDDDWSGDIQILCMANPGYEGENAPEVGFFGMGGDLTSGCVMFDSGKCKLHDLGLKPLEGKLNHHDDKRADYEKTHAAIAMLWKTQEGLDVVDKWKKQNQIG